MRANLLFRVEGVVQKDAFVITHVNFMKIIHIELSHKRRKAIMSKVLGQNDLL